MKIQTKLIKGEMCARPVNPYEFDTRKTSLHQYYEANEPYHPAPGFTEEDVFEGELVKQHKRWNDTEWINDIPGHMPYHISLENRQIYIPLKREEIKSGEVRYNFPKNVGKIIPIWGFAIHHGLKEFIQWVNERYDIIPISPEKVCYCGSLRVAGEAFKKAEYEAVIKGEIALLPCCIYVDIQREFGAESDYKIKADELHKRKIDICDRVRVLNVGGYIGESTRSEIEYAESIHKPISYLEPIDKATSAINQALNLDK